jgi:hypothetical protein
MNLIMPIGCKGITSLKRESYKLDKDEEETGRNALEPSLSHLGILTSAPVGPFTVLDGPDADTAEDVSFFF